MAIDRIDGNWHHDEPFLGRRDYFYTENREESNNKMNGYLTMVRTDFWLPKASKLPVQLFSHLAAYSYKKAFRSVDKTE